MKNIAADKWEDFDGTKLFEDPPDPPPPPESNPQPGNGPPQAQNQAAPSIAIAAVVEAAEITEQPNLPPTAVASIPIQATETEIEEEQQPKPSQPTQETPENEQPFNPFQDQEDWEKQAAEGAAKIELRDFEQRYVRDKPEEGHATVMPEYDIDVQAPELEIAFRKGRELIRKLAAELDFSQRVDGPHHWNAETIAKHICSYKQQKLLNAKYSRPKEADIVMLMDISGSCHREAAMFMAISAGAIGNGVRIYTSFNGVSKSKPLVQPERPLPDYARAQAWVQQQLANQKHDPDHWYFQTFLTETKPKTCVIFGDWDGRGQYRYKTKFRNTRFYWFCNYKEQHSPAPDPCWNARNYFPGVYVPQDLVRVLRRIK